MSSTSSLLRPAAMAAAAVGLALPGLDVSNRKALRQGARAAQAGHVVVHLGWLSRASGPVRRTMHRNIT
jgi:hypothetical protein